MTGARLAIVNADDFGRSAGVNAGVVRAHECGLVTSASLMVHWPAAVEAADYARASGTLCVGLHVDLAEWQRRDGGWEAVYERSGPGSDDIEREVRSQLERFRVLVGADPTHLDSHQHAHRDPPVGAVIAGVAEELSVPARELSAHAVYRGDFYGQGADGLLLPDAIGAGALAALLRTCGPGITELGCHPAARADFESDYAAERVAELEALCSREAAVAAGEGGLRLISFRDLRPRTTQQGRKDSNLQPPVFETG